MPAIITVLLEWIVLSWTAKIINKSVPFPNQSDRGFYWSIIRRMCLRLLILPFFPLPEIVAVLVCIGFLLDKSFTPGEGAELFAMAVVAPVILLPLLILSIMWRAKKLVKQRLLVLSAVVASVE